MRDILREEILFIRGPCKKLVQVLRKREDFNLRSCFQTLVDPNLNVVTNKSMTKFFKRNGFFATEEDVQNIIQRLDVNYESVLGFDQVAKYFLIFDTNNELITSEALASSYVLDSHRPVHESKYFSLGKENLDKQALHVEATRKTFLDQGVRSTSKKKPLKSLKSARSTNTFSTMVASPRMTHGIES